jgi:hypothetical protein
MRNVFSGSSVRRSRLLRSAIVLSLLAVGCHPVGSEGDLAQAQQELADGTTSSVTVGAGGAGGSTGVGGAGGAGAGGGGASGPEAIGFWSFDDCSASSTTLADGSGNGATATRSAQADCAPGIDALGIAFDNKKDIITVPSLASFTFGQTLTAAAWIKPNDISGVHSIINRQGNGKATFDLAIHNGNVELSVTLTNGTVVTSAAPIALGKWAHVAGVFDGTFARLFINGQQVGQVAGAGSLQNVNAPVRIGNSAAQKPFAGTIDLAFLSGDALSAFEISQLSCLRRPSTFTVNPIASGPVPPNTTVSYDVALTNNDVGACVGNDYFLSLNFFDPNINVSVNPQFIPSVAPGQTVHFPMSVTGSEDAEPGAHTIPFDIFNFSNFEQLSGSVVYELSAPTGCFVRTSRELMIRDLGVVEDPIRTTFKGPVGDPRSGVWTFARLMEDMAPTPADAPAMVEQMFRTWLTDQSVNGFTVRARPSIQKLVLDPWPRRADGSLDLTRAPLRLLAIVNRVDVRNLAEGHAGEGRFVFGVVDELGFQTQFTIILEYRLPAATEADVLAWANRWHALGSLPFPSEQYNAALQAITTGFAGRNAAPGRPNGSSLGQLRTNEIALDAPWELREFTLSATDGLLHPATVKLTPDLSFDRTPTLASFINQNEAEILVERHTVPDTFAGVPFLAGSSLNNLTAWTAPGINNNEARHKFSLNTCNGCHGTEETGTRFLHINPRDPGTVAQLSGFLTGITVPDPVTGVPRTLNDLGRRNQDLKALVCATTASPSIASTVIQQGIRRVH